MKTLVTFFLLGMMAVPLNAQIRKARKGGLLEQDPEVVYMDHHFEKAVELVVIKEAPVYSDKKGQHKLGVLKADQKVKLEALTERAYRVRGAGTRDGIVGWVAPWAFASKDPDFVENLKAANDVAVGMTMKEVGESLGAPTKTKVRKTEKGVSGSWEFIDYDEVKHYITRINPLTGHAYRQLSHVTREEKEKIAVEFENDVVTAIEQSEDHGGGNVRIIVPPVIFGW